MMKTAVFLRGDIWWFKWWNLANDSVIAQGPNAPFSNREDAESAKQKFEEERRQRYPSERLESGGSHTHVM